MGVEVTPRHDEPDEPDEPDETDEPDEPDERSNCGAPGGLVAIGCRIVSCQGIRLLGVTSDSPSKGIACESVGERSARCRRPFRVVAIRRAMNAGRGCSLRDSQSIEESGCFRNW